MTNIDHTPRPDSRQLSIFEPQFDGRIRRVEINEVIHFSILDVLEFMGSKGSAQSPSTYWKNARQRFEKQGADEVLKEVLQADFGDKGHRKTPVAPFKFFLRLAQVIEIKEWEYLRNWMAEVAHERMEEMANPGLGTARAYKRDLALLERAGYSEHEAADRLRIRISGIDTYKALCAAIAAKCDNPHFGEIVNTEYIGLFNRTASALKEILHTDSIRDALPAMQLNALLYAETALKEVLKRADKLTSDEICRIANTICRPLGTQLQEICNALGIDAVTGQTLVAAGAL